MFSQVNIERLHRKKVILKDLSHPNQNFFIVLKYIFVYQSTYEISKQRKILSITFKSLTLLEKGNLLHKELAGVHLNCGIFTTILLYDHVSSSLTLFSSDKTSTNTCTYQNMIFPSTYFAIQYIMLSC